MKRCILLVVLCEFLDGVSKNTQMSNLKKIRPLGAEFHAKERRDEYMDGQT
jgi:hypothetical protein